MKEKSILVQIWLISGVFLIFSMVLIGGITRLTNSGLSITEWDLFSEINPFNLSEITWELEFEKYKKFQEYKEYNSHFTVEDFKQIFWWEYIHRMLGRLIGVVFIIPYLIFSYNGYFSVSIQKKLLLVLLMGAFQGFLGWFMVKSGLADKPWVSHYRLAAHLITAFITCAYTYWVYLCYSNGERETQGKNNITNWLNFTMIFLLIQIVLGGFVAGLKAGKVFNTFPKMGDHWIAPQVFQHSLLESMSGVQFLHRYNAYLLGVIVLLTVMKVWNSSSKSIIMKSNYLAIMLIAQICLGIFTLLYHVPIVLALLHQVVAFILLMQLTNIKYYIQERKEVA